MLKQPGFVEARLLKWLTREARVSRLEALGAHFRLIELEGEALKDHVWVPGQKAQIQLGGFVSRTYTPMMWDNAKGATRLLAYLHGDAPASRWVQGLEPDAGVAIFGPRGSLAFEKAEPTLVLFGDETSFGLAVALAATGTGKAHFVFEVTSVPESTQVLAALGVNNPVLVERKSGDLHMNGIEIKLMPLVEAQAKKNVVLTGKSHSVQRLSQMLKKRGLSSSEIRAKAYWAPGKTGLD
jgi:NADPH-dependent ferric siderophore reductase